MKNRLIQFLPVLLIAFVSFATLGIVQAQNRNPCADTPEAERLLSELTTACSEQSSEKIEKFIEKWEQESRTATIYDTNDKLTTTVYQLLDYLMEKYYFNNKELSPDKQGRIVNGNLVFPGEVPVYILSDEEYLDCFRPEDLSSHRWFSQMDYTPQRIIKGYRPFNAPQQIRFLKLIPSYKKAIDSFIDSEVKKSKSFIYSQHALNFYTSKFPVCYSSFLHYPNPRSSPYFSYIVINTSLTEAIIQCDYGFWGETDALQKKNGKWGPAAGNTISIHSIE